MFNNATYYARYRFNAFFLVTEFIDYFNWFVFFHTAQLLIISYVCSLSVYYVLCPVFKPHICEI